MALVGVVEVQLRLRELQLQLQEKANQAMAAVMAALEGWAKAEHPYTDQTANNTNSIQGQIEEASAEIIRGVLSAGMEYSVFLELARDGKYAFLWPVIERHKDDILKIIEETMKL